MSDPVVSLSPSASPDLTVAVMCYNENASLPSFIAELLEVLMTLPIPSEVILIDDGSSDGSAQTAEALVRNHATIRLVRHPQNLGLGGVYRTGFREARGHYLTFFPADGQFSPALIPSFLAQMSHHDLALGVVPARTDSLFGRFLSWAERFLIRLWLGRLPEFQGVFMIRRAMLAQLPLRSVGRGWGIVMEMVLRMARINARIVNVRTELRPRREGHSKVNNWRCVLENLRQIYALRRLLREGE